VTKPRRPDPAALGRVDRLLAETSEQRDRAARDRAARRDEVADPAAPDPHAGTSSKE
jgi:hypothetical protein